MTSHGDLLGSAPILLPVDDTPEKLIDEGKNIYEIAQQFPYSSLAWAHLAEQAFCDQQYIPAYAYARTGYHRGIDALRKNGWKGYGLVPYSHKGNQGWLRCVAALGLAAQAIGEDSEYHRCVELIHESDPTPEVAHRLGITQQEL